MKKDVHLFYLYLPENSWKYMFDGKYNDDFISIYYDLKVLTSRYDDVNHYWYWLYGITDDDDYAETFEAVHDMSMFIKKTKRLSKKEYEILRTENLNAEIKIFNCNDSYSYNDPDDYLLCTRLESNVMIDDAKILLEQMLSDCAWVDYSAFKDEYIKALDTIQYCTHNKTMSAESDFYLYNISYGLTPEGGSVYPTKVNVHNFYLKIFAFVLKK